MDNRGIFKRQTLIRNLKKVVKKIPQLNLPVKIVAIYAFGGMLREKERLHDFDLLILYTMTPEQKARWERFQANFSTFNMNEHRFPIDELKKYFTPHLERGIPLREAVKDETLAKILREKGVEPVWAGCFSWTDTLYNPYGNFIPSLHVVIRKMLLGRRVKGLQAFFSMYKDSIGGLRLVARNYVLAWSPEKPDIEKNLLGRTLHDRMGYLVRELDHFLNDEIPRLKKEYLGAKDSVIKANLNVNVKLDIKALDNQHLEIKRTGNESYKDLLDKCEKARIEMRRYREETEVLREIAYSLERWKRVENRPYFAEHPAEDYTAL